MVLQLQVALEGWGSVLLRLEAVVVLEAVVSVPAKNRRPPRTQATAVSGAGGFGIAAVASAASGADAAVAAAGAGFVIVGVPGVGGNGAGNHAHKRRSKQCITFNQRFFQSNVITEGAWVAQNTVKLANESISRKGAGDTQANAKYLFSHKDVLGRPAAAVAADVAAAVTAAVVDWSSL